MIAKLSGLLDSTGLDWAIIDVNGVGYLISASTRTLRRLGSNGSAVSVHTEMWVSEDKMALYGFADINERDWFRLLTTVQGVGARVALNILSVLAPDRLTSAIAAQDKTTLCEADGVGPKLAARILNELKDKVATLATSPVAATQVQSTAAQPAVSTAVGDAVSALVNLGYKRIEAFTAVNKAAQSLGGEADVSALIRAGLKELSQ
ncbi:Holliday junction branch migration protein RuvA [Niveispirillum cyanobacteriorum]|uniref:Holliday junction branch migration complex subunit RuvA n=1 Tax=Niveispirillum cyanobacteriorum TaxID=1612173 RepID=A0A2K9N9T5_9PROT|nr:Holliday junction branch migration protein RuvA [Niveispirillum cyanobacteriorum]AUN29901.1 Holliday junction branch migration protein RuvA [Niveispirillum cyanobacteriorum]GGE59725.1 Holliday junction ATP-dependent DNA helicase RuvA [Niveispirillum cyanobacteriorum]